MRRASRRPAVVAVLVLWLAGIMACAAPTGTTNRPGSLKILLSNDDGIEAPGLAALYGALRAVGAVTVAAPMHEQSGVSHGVTSRRLIPVRKRERDGAAWYAIDATPATCVRLALESLLADKPDVVVSGINKGENVGLVTFYSATVAAAREAAFLRIPAISVNLQSGGDMDYKAAADFMAALVRELGRGGFRKGLFLNVNIPALPRERIKGIRITRQDVRPTVNMFEKKDHEDEQDLYWPSYKDLDAGVEGTDTWAARNGYISITPMSLDQTDEAGLSGLKVLENLAWK